jgi:hypothetical protein
MLLRVQFYLMAILLFTLNVSAFFSLQGEEEKLFFPLDKREWKIGYQDAEGEESLIEFVLKDEDVRDWSELFTIQKFEGLPVTVKEFLYALQKSANKDFFPGQEIQVKVLEPSSLNILEMSFFPNKSQKEPGSDSSEYNIGRILSGKGTLYYIRYSSKDKATYEKNKQEWIERLKSAYLTESPSTSKNKGHWFILSHDGIFEGSEKMEYQPDFSSATDK